MAATKSKVAVDDKIKPATTTTSTTGPTKPKAPTKQGNIMSFFGKK